MDIACVMNKIASLISAPFRTSSIKIFLVNITSAAARVEINVLITLYQQMLLSKQFEIRLIIFSDSIRPGHKAPLVAVLVRSVKGKRKVFIEISSIFGAA